MAMIVTHGGLVGGYGLYLRDGKPTFVYNYLALDRFTIAGQQTLSKGKVQLTVDFAYQGGPEERGKGATVTLTANGTKIAEEVGDVARFATAEKLAGSGAITTASVSPTPGQRQQPLNHRRRLETLPGSLIEPAHLAVQALRRARRGRDIQGMLHCHST